MNKKENNMNIYSRVCLALMVLAGSGYCGTVAHWDFNDKADIEKGVVKDVTGNGNDLELKVKEGTPADKKAVFSSDRYDAEKRIGGSVRLFGGRGEHGCWFTTSDKAPLNSVQMEKGYTIEIIFKVTPGFETDKHAWMGMLSRLGKPEGDSPATAAISSLGEVQWQSESIKGWERAAWSWDLMLAQWPLFHHAAFVNYYSEEDKTWHVDMYVDGWLGSRNLIGDGYQGLKNYGSRPWLVGTNTHGGKVSLMWDGWIDDIRISDSVLKLEEFTFSINNGQ